MAYNNIPDADIAPGKPGSNSLFTRLRDNPEAIALGLSGATKIANAAFSNNTIHGDKIQDNSIGAAEIEPGGVHTSELNTGTGSVSTTLAHLSYVVTGGMYVFAFQARTNTSAGGAFATTYGGWSTSYSSTPSTTSTSYQTINALGAYTIAGNTAYNQYRYVAASPPHDMGDGDIPAFIYALMDNATGLIESISYATDPVWQANGKTDATPTIRMKAGNFKLAKEIPPEFASMDKLERALAIAKLPDVPVKITEAIKHADMDDIPHPFQGNDLTGKTVVMLDPVSGVVRDLYDIDNTGEDIHEILRDGYVKIGNTGLSRVTPKGLLIPSTTWKKTK